MDNPLLTAVISGFVAIAVVFISGWLQAKRERKQAQREAEIAVAAKRVESIYPQPPTTQQVWERQDKLERALRSALVLLGEVAEQWPHDHAPVLSKRHVAVLAAEGFMPPEWDPPVE